MKFWLKNEWMHNHYYNFMSIINHRLIQEKKILLELFMWSGCLKCSWGDHGSTNYISLYGPIYCFHPPSLKVHYIIMHTFNKVPLYCIRQVYCATESLTSVTKHSTVLPATGNRLPCVIVMYVSQQLPCADSDMNCLGWLQWFWSTRAII